MLSANALFRFQLKFRFPFRLHVPAHCATLNNINDGNRCLTSLCSQSACRFHRSNSLLIFPIRHLAMAPPDRRRVPEFDNRIWLPFAERAALRTVDMQMIAVQPPKGASRGMPRRG